VTASGGLGGGGANGCAAGVGGSGGTISSGSSISLSYSGGAGGTGNAYCGNNAPEGGAGGSSAGTGANGTNGENGSTYLDTAYGGTAPSGGGNGGNTGWGLNGSGPSGVSGAAPGGGGGASGSTQCCDAYTAGSGANGEVVLTPDVGSATTYSSAGTYSYVVADGVSALTVELWGAGGAGGRGYSSGTAGDSAGGGGGGGAFVQTVAVSVAGGETLIVTVGAGGTSGAAVSPGSGQQAGSGSAGGVSSVRDLLNPPIPTVVAKGGHGGSGANGCTAGSGGSGGAAASGGNVSVSYHGGSGGSGNRVCNTNANPEGGAGGSSAGSAANGANGQNGTSNQTTANGGTAPTGGGNGGNAGWNVNGSGPTGLAGSSPGGGGAASGAENCCDAYTAGQGADGQARVTPNVGSATTYSSAGTYTYVVPSGVSSLTVELWGAGGGGGRGYSTGTAADSGGGGGGGGAYAKTTTFPVDTGDALLITVGAGGAVGASVTPGSGQQAGSGSPGGDSSVQPATVTAHGGQGGSGANGCTAGTGGSGGVTTSGSEINLSYSGGSGGTGYVVCGNNDPEGGAGGSSGGTGANGGSGQNGGQYQTTALGGTVTGGGSGGNTGWNLYGSGTGATGLAGSSPGGGGGASGATQCCDAYTAGAGADGQAKVTPNSGSVTTHTSAGNYNDVIGSGVSSVNVELWGAGGGGGRGYSTGSAGDAGGGGGGGGAYLKTTSLPVSPGDMLSITVGAGGAVGSSVAAGSGLPAGGGIAGGDTTLYVNHAPAVPTNLLPVDGRISNNDTPILSSTFTDPDQQDGHIAYTIKTLSGTTVASGQSPTVASGSTASWTVPAGNLTPGTSYDWYAQAVDYLGAASAQVGPFEYTDQYRLGTTRYYTLSSQAIDDQESLGVNVGNGNLVVSANDLQLPGVAGFDLSFPRTYNSLYSSAQDIASVQLASGWQTLAGLGFFTNGDVRYAAANGAEYNFTKNTDGSYTTPPGVDAALVKQGDGSYVLTFDQTGSQQDFSSTGTLIAYKDKNGNTIAFNWSSGQLASITDSFGRTTSFTYNGSGQLTTITDPQNRTYQYSYTSGKLTSFTDPTGKTTSYAYNSAGLLSQITVTTTGSTQEATAISYDSSNRVNSIQTGLNASGACPSGSTCPLTTFAYNATVEGDSFCGSGPTTNVLAPDQQSGGNPTRYCLDSSLRVTGVEAPDGTETLTDYTTGHGGSGCTDSNGNSLDDLPCAVSDSFDPTASNGDWTTYTYSSAHPEDVLSIVQPAPSDATTTYVYGNSSHPFYPTQITSPPTASDPNGVVTTYTYDSAGNTTETDLDSVRQSAYTYNTHGQVSGSEDGEGNWTGFTYDTSGNVSSRTTGLNSSLACPSGQVCPETTYTYDSAGRVLTEVAPLGNVVGGNPSQYTTTYTYDNDGRVLSVTDALGNATSYTYDGAGNKTSVTDANGNRTVYTYNANNQVTSQQSGLEYDSATQAYDCPSGDTCPTTSYTYDANGNKLTETDPNGDTTTYAYNALNQLTSVTTPGANGGTTTYGYDANGNQTTIVDPRGNVSGANPANYTTTKAYNADGQLTSVTDPLGNTTSYGYDAAGNQTSVTDANGNVTLSTYDANNRVTSVQTGMKWNSSSQTYYCPTGADCPKTVYTYDAMGNKTTVTDPNGNQTQYTYNNNGLVASMQSGLQYDSGSGVYDCLSGSYCPTTTYSYDANGNKTSMVEPSGATVSYSYDHDNRLTQTSYSDSTPTVSYTYDAVGNRLSMTDGAGTVNYTYDNNNQLLSSTRGSDTFSYSYDGAGNITSRTYPDGTSASYAYNQDEQLSSVTSSGNTTSYAYDPAGNLLTTTLPNGYVETRTYDDAGRLTETDNANGGTVLSDYAYTLDPVGNPTKVVQTGAVSGTTTYAYDGNNRLIDACYQASCNESPGSNDPYIHYTYDEAGNRLTEARPNVTTSYVYNNNNELCATSTTGTPSCSSPTYSYDANGNETASPSTTFTYNAANQLTSATGGGTTTNYTYDGDGNRLSAETGGSATNYLWDTNNSLPQLAIERDGSGAELRNYLYGLNRISMTTGGSAYYYAYDGLGSVVNVTSSAGATEWTYSYEPFGAIRTQTENDPNAPTNLMQFAGEYLDSTSSFYDLRARDYDASSGRFLSDDPAPFAQSGGAELSSYAYADANPIAGRDPSGMSAIWGATTSAVHLYDFQALLVGGEGGYGAFYLEDHPIFAGFYAWASGALFGPWSFNYQLALSGDVAPYQLRVSLVAFWSTLGDYPNWIPDQSQQPWSFNYLNGTKYVEGQTKYPYRSLPYVFVFTVALVQPRADNETVWIKPLEYHSVCRVGPVDGPWKINNGSCTRVTEG